MRPVIALTAYRESARWGIWERAADLLPAKYADAVWQAGGQPLIVPAIPGAAAEVLGAVDALLVAGGSDLDPQAYGALPHPRLGEVRPDRDATELGLMQEALSSGVPLLGVCRGAQVLNVALGGTLHQHLPDVTGVEHRGGPGVYTPTDVRLSPGSRLAGLLGELAVVCCYHHQALDRLGEGLVPVGVAPDGAIEAVELTGQAWVVGVQWHPEEGDDLRLLAALVEQAGRRPCQPISRRLRSGTRPLPESPPGSSPEGNAHVRFDSGHPTSGRDPIRPAQRIGRG